MFYLLGKQNKSTSLDDLVWLIIPLFQDSMWFIHYIANTEARYMQEKVGG